MPGLQGVKPSSGLASRSSMKWCRPCWHGRDINGALSNFAAASCQALFFLFLLFSPFASVTFESQNKAAPAFLAQLLCSGPRPPHLPTLI